MRLHSFCAEVQVAGDFFGAAALGDELEDFALAWRELVERCGFAGRSGAVEVAVNDAARDGGAEIDLIVENSFDGELEFRDGRVFEHVTARADP